MVPLGNYGRGNPWIPVADGCRRLVGLLADLRSARTQSGKARQQEGIEARTMNAAKELQPEAHRQPLRNRSTPCAQQCPTRQIGHEDSPATCAKRGVSWSFNMWQRQYKQRCKTTPGERLRGASTGGPVADDGSPAVGVQMYKHTMQHVIGNDEAVHLQVPAFRGYVSPQASGLQNT